MYTPELQAIEANVKALETKLKDIKAYVKKEREAIPKALALHEACKSQSLHLDHIAAHLPRYLPSLSTDDDDGRLGHDENINNTVAAVAVAVAAAKKQGSPTSLQPRKQALQPQAQQQAPQKRFITQEEFDSISPYMRGRLTADKLNAALEEIIERATSTATLVTAARRNRPLGADRKHAQWLLYNLAPHEALKGRVWVMESDLKSGAALRLDKTGKTMLTLLRHLGRLSETRISADGSTHIIYAIL